jgi:hypothetical protein
MIFLVCLSFWHYSSPHSCYMPCPSHPPWLEHSNYTWRRVQVMKLLIMQFLQHPVTSFLFHPNILLSAMFSNTLRLGPHERTKCVRCNALCDVRCRNRKKPIARHARTRMLGSIGLFLFLQRTSQSALQRTHFVRSCGTSLSLCSSFKSEIKFRTHTEPQAKL